MTLYDDSGHAVRPEVATAHEAALDSFRRPGTWWTGAQRAEIVAEARRARIDAGVQSPDGFSDRGPGALADLPDAARTTARQVAVAPKNIDRAFYDSVVPDGLTDTEYVETVSVTARAADLDVFARGIGAPMADVGEPENGEPSRIRPDGADDDTAFAPMIHNGRRGGDAGKELYGGEMMPNILRATSLVPDEFRHVAAIVQPQYVPLDQFMNLDFTNDPAISRTQMELVAGRISAINECFY
jgi:hypothetical protein